MKKLSLVLCALALAGCAHTSTEVSEPIACSTDCDARFQNVKAVATKFLGYSITHETSNSFTAQLVSIDKSVVVTSAMNVFKMPEQIYVEIETSGVSDVSTVNSISNLTSHEDFRTIKTHKVQSVVIPNTYTENLFRIPH